MHITPLYSNCYNRNIVPKNYSSVPKFSAQGLMRDTVSFGAMKKNEFSGIDLLVVEKFNAPIEKFKTNDDFSKWAENEISDILGKDYNARTYEASIQRDAIIGEWKKYFEEENKEYTPSEKLLIYDGITKNLKPDNDTIPPILNKGALADTMYQLKEDLKTNPKMAFNFSKNYTNNIRKAIFEESKPIDDITGWVKIPSKAHDEKNFEKNVDKLKTLSHNSWCTKSNMAEPYLSRGDFYIYFEQGHQKLSVRFDGDKIVELAGAKNDGKLPQDYISTFETFMKDNEYSEDTIADSAKYQYDNAKDLKEKIAKEKQLLKENGISLEAKDNDYEKLFNFYDMETSRDKNGMLILSHYDEPKDISFNDLGIDGSKLFKNVSKIEGDAKFCSSEMTDLGNLEEIGGNVNLKFSKIRTLGHLKKIGGNFETGWDALKDTGDLEEIGGNVIMHSWAGYEFKNLKRVGGNFDVGKINTFVSLGNLEEIGGDLIKGSNIEDFGNLKKIGGNADFEYLNMTEPFNIEEIGGNVNFTNADIKVPLSIKKIGGDMNCRFADIESFGNLETIGGNLYLGGADVNDFGAIKEVKEKITALDEDKQKLYETMRKNKKWSFWDKLFGRDKKDNCKKNSFDEEHKMITEKITKKFTRQIMRNLGMRDKSKE
ncbi:hypothetical protein IJI31_00195 [bacterium]|nr:hypothetical protein [bacterium]